MSTSQYYRRQPTSYTDGKVEANMRLGTPRKRHHGVGHSQKARSSYRSRHDGESSDSGLLCLAVTSVGTQIKVRDTFGWPPY